MKGEGAGRAARTRRQHAVADTADERKRSSALQMSRKWGWAGRLSAHVQSANIDQLLVISKPSVAGRATVRAAGAM